MGPAEKRVCATKLTVTRFVSTVHTAPENVAVLEDLFIPFLISDFE